MGFNFVSSEKIAKSTNFNPRQNFYSYGSLCVYILMSALCYIIITLWLVITLIGTDYISQPYRQQEAICDATEAIYELFLARDFP